MENDIFDKVMFEIDSRIDGLSIAWEYANDCLESDPDPEMAKSYHDRTVNYATKCLELMRLRRRLKEIID